ncbi:hypothetical protein AMTR_s00011p00125430, partial [Amborella trichopoda]
MGHGGSPPHLRQMAMKILNMTCSSSGCEPNVSAFAMVHTKKRNILEKRQLNDLVFVQYNQKLQERHPQLEHDQREAIEAFGIDDACEWLVDASDDEAARTAMPPAYDLGSNSKPKEGEGEDLAKEGSDQEEE